MKGMKKFLFLGVFIFIALFGCSKVNRDNYDKIKVGMDYQEVVSIIGKPDMCDSALGAKSCIWGSADKNISVKFVGDKVVFPSMKGL